MTSIRRSACQCSSISPGCLTGWSMTCDESNRPALAHGERLFVSLGSTLGLLGEETAVFSRGETLRHLKRVGLDEAAVEKAIQDRAEARKRKDYKGADEIRSMLLEKGIILLDTPNGTTWRTK